MGILAGIQAWVAEYDAITIQPLTDRPEIGFSQHAIAPAGGGTISTDILGNRTYTNSYVFLAQEKTTAEPDRAGAHDFLEALSAWIEGRADEQDFPVLPTGYEVDDLQVANGILSSIDDDGLALYQIQLQMTYTQKGD